jgi:hypothetical protein
MLVIKDAYGEEFTNDFFHGLTTGIHKHSAVKLMFDTIRKDNNKPKKQFGPDARFNAILLAARKSYNGESSSRIWPNITKTTKL